MVRVAYVGLTTGQVVSVDMETGTILDRLELTKSPIRHLRVDGLVLYALSDTTLFTLPIASRGELERLGSASSPFTLAISPNRRLSVGGGFAYAVHGTGANVFDVTDPTQPALVSAAATAQRGWRDFNPNGSGLAVGAVGANVGLDETDNVSVYDLTDPTLTDQLVTIFATPGSARAVALFNGLAYVADHDRGLQIINYVSRDSVKGPEDLRV